MSLITKRNLRRIILVIISFLIFIVLIFLFDNRLPKSLGETINNAQILSDITQKQAAEGKKKSGSLLSGFKINDIPCAYAVSSKTFYYSVPEAYINQEIRFFLQFESDEKEVNVVFENNDIKNDMIIEVKTNKIYNFTVFSKEKYYDYKLIFTTLPLMTINTENSREISTGDLYCEIALQDPDYFINNGDSYITSMAYLHVRGGASRMFDKKGYKMELQEYKVDKVTEKTLLVERKKSLLGMRKDGDWILDAMFIDPTRIHNKITIDIWNEFGAPAYTYGINNGCRGEYAEIIMNGKYHGLYCILEPIDEKQLGIAEATKETEGGVMIKSTSWEHTVLNSYSGEPTGKTWAGFEIRYPKEPSINDWDMFYELVTTTVDTERAVFGRQIPYIVDIENLIDYWILVKLTSAIDNVGKNMFWSIRDREDENPLFFTTPWDLDLSWGYTWTDDGSVFHRIKNAAGNVLGYHLGDRILRADAAGAKKMLYERWAELRKQTLSNDAIIKRIDELSKFLKNSGAIKREFDRWPNPKVDFDEEINYMKKWFILHVPHVEKAVMESTK